MRVKRVAARLRLSVRRCSPRVEASPPGGDEDLLEEIPANFFGRIQRLARAAVALLRARGSFYRVPDTVLPVPQRSDVNPSLGLGEEAILVVQREPASMPTSRSLTGLVCSSMPEPYARRLSSIVDDRDRFDLDQVIGVGQRLHPDECVGRLVIAEQRQPARFDRRQVLAPVIDDEDRDLGHLLRPSTCGCESTTDVAEHLASLGRRVTGTDEVVVLILGLLPGDEDQPVSGRDDDLRVCRGSGQILGVDEFERHGSPLQQR
jgi:hypothetical protein